MCAGELARAHKASCFHSITRRPRSCGNVDVDNFFVSHRATGARRRERRRPRRPCGARQASREERMYKKIKQRRREMATAGAAPTPSILHFPLYTGVGGIFQQTDLFAVNAAHIPGIAKAARPEQIRLFFFRDRRASSNCYHGCLRFQGVPLKNADAPAPKL